LFSRWSALDALPRTTPRQLLAHTSGVPYYFNEEAFLARLRRDPDHIWRPVGLVDHAAAYGTPSFPPGQGFAYSDTGYVIAGVLVEQVTGRPLHQVYRELVFDPLGLEHRSRPATRCDTSATGSGWERTQSKGVELLGHTGFIGAFLFHAPEYGAVLVGIHNASHVARWPLVAALCRELRIMAVGEVLVCGPDADAAFSHGGGDSFD
jgi:CubicO group peptidase (beta-lactamase class C family)